MLVLWSLLCNFFTKHFRYLKWRNPHLYKLYGYSLCKGNPTPKTAKNKVQETLHFRYLKLLDLLVIFVSWHLSKVADESQQQLRSEQEPSQRRWFGPKILVKCSMFLVNLARDLTRPIYPKCLVREISLFQGNLGWWNIIIWPDVYPNTQWGWYF